MSIHLNQAEQNRLKINIFFIQNALNLVNDKKDKIMAKHD